MKKQKIVLAMVLIAILISSVVSFTGAQEKKLYIPLISKGFQHQFWLAVKAGAEQAPKILM